MKFFVLWSILGVYITVGGIIGIVHETESRSGSTFGSQLGYLGVIGILWLIIGFGYWLLDKIEQR